MKDHESFPVWADGVYNSMENAARATPSPFLLTQVLQKSQGRPSGTWEMITYWLTKPAVAFSILFLVVALNVLLIAGNGNMQLKITDNNNDFFTTSITSVYDVDNITP